MSDIEGWQDVHRRGGVKKPWNTGIPYRGSQNHDTRRTERRFKARRQRDIDEARKFGLYGPEFERIAAEYLAGNGNV